MDLFQILKKKHQYFHFLFLINIHISLFEYSLWHPQNINYIQIFLNSLTISQNIFQFLKISVSCYLSSITNKTRFSEIAGSLDLAKKSATILMKAKIQENYPLLNWIWQPWTVLTQGNFLLTLPSYIWSIFIQNRLLSVKINHFGWEMFTFWLFKV